MHRRIFAERHLDGQAFLHHDNKKDVTESQRLGAEAIRGPETWATETKGLRDTGEELRMSLEDLLALKAPRRGESGVRAKRMGNLSQGSSGQRTDLSLTLDWLRVGVRTEGLRTSAYRDLY